MVKLAKFYETLSKYRLNIIAGIFAILGLFLWLVLLNIFPKYELEKLGFLGDFFGGTAAPLLNFASLLLFLSAYLLQRDELKSNRKELKLQRFENTFFQMVSLHHQIVNDFNETTRQFGSIDTTKETFTHITGRSLIAEMYKYFEKAYKDSLEKVEISRILTAFNYFLDKYQYLILHYFENLTQIIRLIDESHLLTSEEKLVYINIIRAQLSTHEKLLIFYYAMTVKGMNELKPLVDRYQLLVNLQDSLLLNQNHRGIYNSVENYYV